MHYLVLSALVFLVPYIYPQLWFLLFFALVPLMYSLFFKQTGFWAGFAWSQIVFSGLLYWALQMLFGYRCSALTLLCWSFLVLWYALIGGLWMWGQQRLASFLRMKQMSSATAFCTAWILTGVLYFYGIVYASLFFCDVVEGYPFFNPFIVCAYAPWVLWIVYYVGCLGALFLFVGFQTFLTAGLLFDTRFFLPALLCIAPFLSGFLLYKPDVLTLASSVFVTPSWATSKEPMHSGYRMVSCVAAAVRQRPEVCFICMPESAFNWDVAQYPDFWAMMAQDAPGVCIGFGGHHRDSEGLKSSFFVIEDGIVIFMYDKRHLIPMMERDARLFSALGLNGLLSQDEFFAYGDAQRCDVVQCAGHRFQVFICSEFFFEAKKVRGIPILFVCNDAWLTCDYAKYWVDLFVRYIQVRYRVPVIFGTVCGNNNINSCGC